MRAAHRTAYAALLIALLTLTSPWLNGGSPDGSSVAAAGGSAVPRAVEPVEPGPTPFDGEATVVEPPGDDWSDGGGTAQPPSNEGDGKGPKPDPTPTADPTTAPTAGPTPTPTPDPTEAPGGIPSAPGDLLISASRLQDLPTSGSAWDYLVKVARSDWPAPELDDQDSRVNVEAFAAALVYARTGEPAMGTKVRAAIAAMIPTYDLSQDAGLGPARQLAGWVMAADLVGLEGSLEGAFRDLLRRALRQPIGSHARWGASLAACHEDADNNWGAWCGAARIAAARYLGDGDELARAWRVYRGFLGDRDAWSGFRGQGTDNAALSEAIRSWACDGSAAGYVPTNPGCGDRGGAFPADISRDDATYSRIGDSGRMYQSETTAGLVLQAELLHRAGYPSWAAVGGALARVAAFDVGHGAWNLGTVQYHWPWLINRRLGTSYPTVAAKYGRSLGFTDWLYGRRSGGEAPTPTATPKPTATPSPTRTPRPKPTPESTATATASPPPGRVPQPKSGASPSGDVTPTAAPLASPATDPPPAATPDAAGGLAPTEPPGSCHASGGTAAAATRHLVRPSLVAGIFVAALDDLEVTAGDGPVAGPGRIVLDPGAIGDGRMEAIRATLTSAGGTPRYRLARGGSSGGDGLLVRLSGPASRVSPLGAGSIVAPALFIQAGRYVVGFFAVTAASTIAATPVTYSRATCS